MLNGSISGKILDHIIFFLSIRFSCIAIHCEWDEWKIGECSRSCGTGTRMNNRTKLVEEAHGGTCNGQSSEIVECNTQPCPGMI